MDAINYKKIFPEVEFLNTEIDKQAILYNVTTKKQKETIDNNLIFAKYLFKFGNIRVYELNIRYPHKDLEALFNSFSNYSTNNELYIVNYNSEQFKIRLLYGDIYNFSGQCKKHTSSWMTKNELLSFLRELNVEISSGHQLINFIVKYRKNDFNEMEQFFNENEEMNKLVDEYMYLIEDNNSEEFCLKTEKSCLKNMYRQLSYWENQGCLDTELEEALYEIKEYIRKIISNSYIIGGLKLYEEDMERLKELYYEYIDLLESSEDCSATVECLKDFIFCNH